MNLIFAITSTGKNMFDEYRDEPCLIIDDLRPVDMRFSDLLGILDPYNFKAAQAKVSKQGAANEDDYRHDNVHARGVLQRLQR